ncbi:MAG: hypothetical protein A2312_04295 [Candidatus Staskawiczbacteria bacterium RIFOXYB2_FULL_32_9]|uniref:Uncharacterized protein n=1 Tax=Candidatus Staskawiczbacteria bacterium RIFOXYD1_FULL_32_13 TaxID=1802234 RepID=A0A1G2JK41_9BACT|nr:MAG: hypothetical protein UR22_C0009G0029 [Parcubacteria group bacterium GW2011_GWC2_32_10]OFZ11813.1 MAG: hypothetical protein A2465_06145 [Bacteroidetes bacterium RIFOXYC2_FULL_39_11]OGZ78038.1 MAG: hypothetical protein A2360_02695 [Candidatus Staskawiczbacteria bacterium RIFOXYB1_FULL_32_11]OGZ80959.1 MAG: hypothetical protein A2256_00370 [Candidatus Staskawiczbacteria bacterium RIFOXYA2_FULL_32_7]OGZ81845.1 MAG: hypothetical protein A2312_04295 [Candidatus Staskawiczbacteria bacterium RI
MEAILLVGIVGVFFVISGTWIAICILEPEKAVIATLLFFCVLLGASLATTAISKKIAENVTSAFLE